MAEVGDVERRPVILVCRTAKRSAKVAEVLRGAGFAAQARSPPPAQ
jgi:rhodanese-related sulfurtransferase